MKQQIVIKAAVVIGNTITLECSPSDCDKARAVIDEGKPLAAVIGTASQKRSLSANAYAWALMNQLSAKINRPVLDIYRDLIRDIGGSSALVTLRAECQRAVKAYCQKNNANEADAWKLIAETIGKPSKNFTAEDWKQGQQIAEAWK